MRIGYVCKAVDETNPTVATQVRWIRELAARPQVEHVRVLTRTLGPATLGDNVTVTTFGHRGWPATVLEFWRQVLAQPRAEIDLYFVAQGGPYPALLLPLKLFRSQGIVQWKAHAHVSSRMRFYARYCDDLVFTPTPSSLPLDLPNIRVVGHGIDTELFRPPAVTAPSRDLVAVGRIAPIKRLDVALDLLRRCRVTWGTTPSLDIVGPCQAKDSGYLLHLEHLVEELGLSEDVRFLGSVSHDELPGLLGGYRASINLSDTAFDKAAGESMAVGVPVVTSNDCTTEMLPADLRPLLAAGRQDSVGLAELVHDVVGWDDDTRARIGATLRANVVENHSLNALFDKILTHVEAQD
jgi:glycosyltransferase involved in cell wall biosynthesis